VRTHWVRTPQIDCTTEVNSSEEEDAECVIGSRLRACFAVVKRKGNLNESVRERRKGTTNTVVECVQRRTPPEEEYARLLTVGAHLQCTTETHKTEWSPNKACPRS
jgi:hypothetical protein